MYSLKFVFFCSLIEELCTKEENYKTSCKFNFGHECNIFHEMLTMLHRHIESDNQYTEIDRNYMFYFLTDSIFREELYKLHSCPKLKFQLLL